MTCLHSPPLLAVLLQGLTSVGTDADNGVNEPPGSFVAQRGGVGQAARWRRAVDGTQVPGDGQGSSQTARAGDFCMGRAPLIHLSPRG